VMYLNAFLEFPVSLLSVLSMDCGYGSPVVDLHLRLPVNTDFHGLHGLFAEVP
jgi:hypothetical protein